MSSWSKNQPPLVAAEISQKLNIEVLPASIRFLGVWDTVPGSSLKNYGVCKEDIGVVKDKLSILIPGVDRGERINGINDRHYSGSAPDLGAYELNRHLSAPIFLPAPSRWQKN